MQPQVFWLHSYDITVTSRGRTHGKSPTSFNNQRGRSHSHNNNSSNSARTHSGQGRRPPCNQICRTEGHYVDCCNQLYVQTDSGYAHLVEAFNTSCFIVGPETTNWFLDAGASAHITVNPTILDQSKNYTGKDFVIVGNSASLPITHTDTLSRVPNIQLLMSWLFIISLKIFFQLVN